MDIEDGDLLPQNLGNAHRERWLRALPIGAILTSETRGQAWRKVTENGFGAGADATKVSFNISDGLFSAQGIVRVALPVDVTDEEMAEVMRSLGVRDDA